MVNASSNYVDELEAPESLPEPERIAVYRIADIAYAMPPERMQNRQREKGTMVRPMLHIDWEPLSFKYDFNPAVFTENPNNYEQAWVTCRTADNTAWLGPRTTYGQIANAFKGLGYPLTKNEVFRPQLLGRIFKCKTVEEPNPNGGYPFTHLEPVEELASYTPTGEVRVLRRGYGGGGGATIASAEPTAEQVAAIKEAVNGKSEAEYVDAIMDSGDPLIMCDPFMREAGDPSRLTERLVRYGGKVISGRMFFEAA